MWPKLVYYWSAVSNYYAVSVKKYWLIVIAVLHSMNWLNCKLTRTEKECQKGRKFHGTLEAILTNRGWVQAASTSREKPGQSADQNLINKINSQMSVYLHNKHIFNFNFI